MRTCSSTRRRTIGRNWCFTRTARGKRARTLFKRNTPLTWESYRHGIYIYILGEPSSIAEAKRVENELGVMENGILMVQNFAIRSKKTLFSIVPLGGKLAQITLTRYFMTPFEVVNHIVAKTAAELPARIGPGPPIGR